MGAKDPATQYVIFEGQLKVGAFNPPEILLNTFPVPKV